MSNNGHLNLAIKHLYRIDPATLTETEYDDLLQARELLQQVRNQNGGNLTYEEKNAEMFNPFVSKVH